MRIDGPQITGSFSLNGDGVQDLDSLVTTSSLNTYTSSMETTMGHVNTATHSLNTFTSSATTRLNSIEGVTGSYATTGSNLFKGTQTLSGSIIPAVDNTYDLGSVTHQFRDLYLSSASLYIDGTKVLSSTTQELQITTDAGQSFKILEAGSDTITLQSNDGNITLASSGGGDVIMDPTNGIIALKGTTTIYAGNRILSSDGNNIHFGNGVIISGSLLATGTNLLSGSQQIGEFGYTTTSSVSTISSSINTRIDSITNIQATTGSNNFIGTQTITGSLYISQNLIVQGSSSLQDITGSNVYIGTNKINLNTDTPAIRFGGISVFDSGSNFGESGSLLWDSQDNHWIYQHPASSGAPYKSAILISGPRNSGSLGDEQGLTSGKITKAVGDDHIEDSIMTETNGGIGISGSLSISGSIIATGTSLVSGSSQILNGTTIHSGSFFNGITVVSGSAQVDVMSTTNIARLATTGSNVFTGALSGTTATFSGNITTTGQLYIAGGSNINIGYRLAGTASGQTQWLLGSSGTGGVITAGGFAIRNETTGYNPLTIESTGLATFSRVAMTTQASYDYQNIRVNSGFGSGYTDARIQSLLAGYDGSIYGTDIGYSYDGTGYSLRFATNDDLTGNPIERLRISSTGLSTFSGNILVSKAGTASVELNSTTNTSYSAFLHSESGTPKGYWEYINSAFSDSTRRNYLEAYNSVGGFAIYTAGAKALDISTTGAATFSNTINVKSDINIGDYTTNTTLTFQSVNNGSSRINFYDANNTEGVYIKNTGVQHGGNLRFGARWDDDEDKVFFNLRQSSAGAAYDVRFGLNVDPEETFHVSSNGITASAPSKGWPVYDAELDTNARRFIFQTAGNGGVSTAGQGASTALILGQYFDSRVIITTPGAGSASPSDQGVGRGRDMMIKAGASDNTVGYVGGRLYLNGGIGFNGSFAANGGHIIMQSLAGSGNVGINDTSPQTKLSINGANYVEMATFACTTAGSNTIVADNYGHVQFSNGTARHLSNSSVFTAVTDGIQILKAGIVYVSFSQDIITAGASGYTLGYIQKNKSTISENLITNTNGQWDGINGVTTISVVANDVINFYFSATDIISFDPNTWSNYSFVWTSR